MESEMVKEPIDLQDQLADLYERNDRIERDIAKLNRHGRRENYSKEELETKQRLMAELNAVIDEIERLQPTEVANQ